MSSAEDHSELEMYADAAARCACNNFRKASRAITQLFDQILEPSGLRSTQLVILLEIAASRSSTVPQLARRLVMDRSTLQRNIQPLVNRGLIRVATKSGRSRGLALTAQGRNAVKHAVPLWTQAQAGFVEQLGPDRWNSLIEDLPAAVDAAKGVLPARPVGIPESKG